MKSILTFIVVIVCFNSFAGTTATILNGAFNKLKPGGAAGDLVNKGGGHLVEKSAEGIKAGADAGIKSMTDAAKEKPKELSNSEQFGCWMKEKINKGSTKEGCTEEQKKQFKLAEQQRIDEEKLKGCAGSKRYECLDRIAAAKDGVPFQADGSESASSAPAVTDCTVLKENTRDVLENKTGDGASSVFSPGKASERNNAQAGCKQ